MFEPQTWSFYDNLGSRSVEREAKKVLPRRLLNPQFGRALRARESSLSAADCSEVRAG
jgi:hypothetical protein